MKQTVITTGARQTIHLLLKYFISGQQRDLMVVLELPVKQFVLLFWKKTNRGRFQGISF